MQRTASLVSAVAVAVATVACSSSEPAPAPAPSGGRDGGATPIGEGRGGSGGGGPCAIEDNQDACGACVAEASPKCNATVCREESLALENCTVAAVYLPCEDEMGNESIDCCPVQGAALIDCWNAKCPEMQACM